MGVKGGGARARARAGVGVGYHAPAPCIKLAASCSGVGGASLKAARRHAGLPYRRSAAERLSSSDASLGSGSGLGLGLGLGLEDNRVSQRVQAALCSS